LTSQRLIPADAIRDPEVRAFADEARAFLLRHSWCNAVASLERAWAVAGVLGVFLAEIVPARPGIDARLWVVVGDLPPAYLVLDDAPNWREALRCYVAEMERWVEAAKIGAPTDELIPVNVEPSPESVALLESRLRFVEREMVESEVDDVGDT
jgi:hypothetical protein